MNTKLKPLFLFSVPRSGSTLIQRILSTHPKISTVTEPWILLPYLYTLKDGGAFTEYGHRKMVSAVRDFYQNFPGGKDNYIQEIKSLVLRLYEKAVEGNPVYFLDKTPRYHLVSDEILQMFPEGKFIVIWRNPLAVAASIINTWKNGKWNLHEFYVDLYTGINNLSKTFKTYRKNVLFVKYEDLLSEPESTLKKIFAYIELDYDHTIIDNWHHTDIAGEMGDKVGYNNYMKISNEPLEKWRRTLRNPIRKYWAKRYLTWIGRERLGLMGYDMATLCTGLNDTPTSFKYLFSDVIRIIYSYAFPVRKSLKHRLLSPHRYYQVYSDM